MRALTVFLVALAMAGCANQSLYSWGNYEQMLYQSYKDPTKTQELKVALEAHIASADQSSQRVPPGIYAELGTLYLQDGATDKAVAMYKREREAWPESKGLMDVMIGNLERMQKSGGAR
jgi:hypothetical protein